MSGAWQKLVGHVVFALLVTLLALLAIRHVRSSLDEHQRCYMTVMWYWPMFIVSVGCSIRTPIALPAQPIDMPAHRYEKYGYKLIVYGEAVYGDRLQAGQFNGAPVLFIPGNAGSCNQGVCMACAHNTRAVQFAHSVRCRS
jgi:hypothetical protein